jgi:hypothetical protein
LCRIPALESSTLAATIWATSRGDRQLWQLGIIEKSLHLNKFTAELGVR